jgi:hypothetical protein
MDVALLVLSYKLNVRECGEFTKEEFVRGLTEMDISTLSQLKSTLVALREYADKHSSEIYLYAFRTLKEFDSQLTVPLEGALEMIKLFQSHLPHGKGFVRFMNAQTDYTGMNYDQWSMFLQFNQQISLDFENYDHYAWPVMFDDFIAFMRTEETLLQNSERLPQYSERLFLEKLCVEDSERSNGSNGSNGSNECYYFTNSHNFNNSNNNSNFFNNIYNFKYEEDIDCEGGMDVI